LERQLIPELYRATAGGASCDANLGRIFLKADVIADEEKGAIMSEAGASSCGEKPKGE
jgi:hypothetical protein